MAEVEEDAPAEKKPRRRRAKAEVEEQPKDDATPVAEDSEAQDPEKPESGADGESAKES